MVLHVEDAGVGWCARPSPLGHVRRGCSKALSCSAPTVASTGEGLRVDETGTRRSMRVRHKPLEFWRMETKQYQRDHKSEWGDACRAGCGSAVSMQ